MTPGRRRTEVTVRTTERLRRESTNTISVLLRRLSLRLLTAEQHLKITIHGDDGIFMMLTCSKYASLKCSLGDAYDALTVSVYDLYLVDGGELSCQNTVSMFGMLKATRREKLRWQVALQK